MSSALRNICERKREHVAARQSQLPGAAVETGARQAPAPPRVPRAPPPPRRFRQALAATAEGSGYPLIAEFKQASPSKGLIRADLDAATVARAYERGGATCLSVLTDQAFFGGSDTDLAAARAATSLPVLRKDFMIDVWQVAESRMLGADCILVILAALGDGLAAEIESAAIEWGMDVLLEVHDEPELERALCLRSPLLGINNRNLKTLHTDPATTAQLAPLAAASGRLVVAESGLATREDLASAWSAGARGFLIGESLMRHDDHEAAVRSLVFGAPPPVQASAAPGPRR